MSGPVQTRREAIQEWIYRFTVAAPPPTTAGWNFQPLSLLRGIAQASAALAVANGFALYRALLRRYTVKAAAGDDLVKVARERGRRQRGPVHAQMPVIFVPRTARVTAITAAGFSDLLEVLDSTDFAIGVSVRVRNIDGSVSEAKVITNVTAGTGPNGYDELVVTALVNVYAPNLDDDDVQVLFRATVPAGTLINTRSGVQYQTLDATTTGDSNAVFAGESSALGLADKAIAECTTAGASGNVAPNNVTGLAVPITGVLQVVNPEAGRYGADTETDLELKRRTMSGPSEARQETRTWFETMLLRSDEDVARVIPGLSSDIGVMAVLVQHRNGGAFSVAELGAMKAWLEERVRSYMTIDVENVTLTSVEVEAQITLEPGYRLRAVLTSVADRVVTHPALDFRKAEFGSDVDNSLLLALVRDTPGVRSVDTASFLPAAPVVVGDTSLPRLTRVSLLDRDTGVTINATVAVGF